MTVPLLGSDGNCDKLYDCPVSDEFQGECVAVNSGLAYNDYFLSVSLSLCLVIKMTNAQIVPMLEI